MDNAPRSSTGLARPTHHRDLDLEDLEQGRLYFYVGSGLSAMSGMITWPEMIRCIQQLRQEQEGKSVPPAGDDAVHYCQYMDEWLRERIDPSKQDSPRILSASSNDPRTFSRVVLLNIMFRYARGGWIAPEVPKFDIQHKLWRARCHGILTSNYDVLLEHAYYADVDKAIANLRSYRYDAEFLDYIFSNPVFLLKLHGDINDLKSMLLDPERAWERGDEFCGSQGVLIKKVYERARRFGHVIFLGAGMRDRTILELQSAWRAKGASSEFRCLALLPAKELSQVPREVKELSTRCSFEKDPYDDVEFVVYGEEEDRGKVLHDFLDRLANKRRFLRVGEPVSGQAWTKQESLRQKASEVSQLFIDWTKPSR